MGLRAEGIAATFSTESSPENATACAGTTTASEGSEPSDATLFLYNDGRPGGRIGLQRRDWIKTAIAGSGAVAAAPLVTQIVPAPAPGAQAGANPAWKPLLFDSHQNKTVVALTELVIPATDTPGAKAAKVNEYIDLMLHDVASDKGHGFLKGLGWLDGHAIRSHGAPFVALEEEHQIAILESLDEAEDPDLAAGAEFFARLKRLTVEGYYTSRIGIAELNKNGVPATFACEHDDHG